MQQRFIWNPSHCECECDKSCDFGVYLDYEDWKCRKKLVDKLIEEYTENIYQVKLAGITLAGNKNKHKCSSCTMYIVLFSIIFRINVGIGTYFVCSHWYTKKMFLVYPYLYPYSCIHSFKQQFNELINGKSETNRDQWPNLLFLQGHNQSQKFWIKLVKNRQKTLQSD